MWVADLGHTLAFSLALMKTRVVATANQSRASEGLTGVFIVCWIADAGDIGRGPLLTDSLDVQGFCK